MDDRETQIHIDRRGGDRRQDGPQGEERKSAQVRSAIRSELAVDDTGRRRRGPNAPPVVEVDHVSLAFDVPILAAIEGAGLHDAGVVVVRWYGGVKLGTGGLSRAYRETAAETP